MALIYLGSLDKKRTILSSSTVGPAVDYYSTTNSPGNGLVFESLLWESAPAESIATGYPAVPSQNYSWSLAPEWANWAAFNENGLGNWFESRPVLDEYKGCWRAGTTERRSWPMSANTVLTRGWRASLGYRPTAIESPSTKGACGCPTASDTIVTDVTGYIAVTMGDAVLLPESCRDVSEKADSDVYSSESGSIILLQESGNGVDWVSFGRAVLTSINSPVTFSYTPTRTFIRAVVSSIWGKYSFATVTVSGLA